MEVQENTSTVFQAQLRPTDVKFFENPESQPRYNPMNCGAVSGQLLGIVSKSVSEEMTKQRIGVALDEWVNELNKLAGSQIYRKEPASLQTIRNSLFPGFATLALFTRIDNIGHYAVIAVGKDNNLYILDPQIRKVFKNDEITQYIQEGNLDGPIYILRTPPRTKSEHISAFIDDILAGHMSACHLGGKRKRSTRKRKTRSLRKRNTRKRR